MPVSNYFPEAFPVSLDDPVPVTEPPEFLFCKEELSDEESVVAEPGLLPDAFMLPVSLVAPVPVTALPVVLTDEESVMAEPEEFESLLHAEKKKTVKAKKISRFIIFYLSFFFYPVKLWAILTKAV